MGKALSVVRDQLENLLVLALFAMVALAFIDVIGRRLFQAPLYGAHDLTEHMMAVIVFCGLPLLTSARGHLVIDLFDRFLRAPWLRWWFRAIDIAVAAAFALISYKYLEAGFEAGRIREISQELSIPRSGMYFFIAALAAISALAAVLPASARKAGDGDAADPPGA